MATLLPDGSVVANPPGKRAVVPKGSGTAIVRPNVAAGGGAGAKGKAVGVTTKQPGRRAVSNNNYH